ncbi:MAG TPA: ABC transporter substrate-binding protein [Methylomirabilota bacterium]|nr:ABC transporter substrate-binding protein [Methylomirabilota bacterium]
MRLRLLPLVVALLVLLALISGTTLAPGSAQEAKTQKLVFASAGFEDSNRFWMVARPDHLQYDPFLETLLEVDPKTGEYTPRLAEKWSASPDYREWTFTLRKGVQFHYGYGPFTARDVVHSHAFMMRPESTATLAGFWRQVEEIKVVNDHQIVFRFKRPTTVMPYAASRAGDLRIVSKAQWDKEGQEGFDRRPAGTGSYRYVGRQPGLSITFERVDKHWGGERPAFKELEFRLAREESTRLALLLSGEAHIADLPRELQKDALKKGLKIFSSSFPVDWMTVYMGGQYYMPGDPAFKTDVPWTRKKVRQALNMAINRKELLSTVFAGKGTFTYVTGWSEKSEGYNPEWQHRFDKMYGYDPAKAKALLKEAGYGPGQLKFKILAFTEPGESEGPQVAEALGIYYKDIGVETEIEVLDWAKVREMFRKKAIGCCIWPNIISWRPSEEWIRTSYYSKSNTHHYENEFTEKTYAALTQTVKPEERQRLARAIADHLFEEFADIPLFWFANEVVANPKVVADWVYPGIAAGRSTHFHLVKSAK